MTSLFSKIRLLLFFALVVLVVIYDNTDNVFWVLITFIVLFVISVPSFFNIRFRPEHLSIFGFVIFGLLSFLWTIDSELSYIRWLTCFSMSLLFLLVLSLPIKSIKVFNYSLYAYILGSLILLIFEYRNIGASILMTMTDSSQLDTWDVLNVNAMGKYFAISSVLCLYFATYKKQPLFYVLFAVFFIMVIVLKSKSALLSVLVGDFLYLFYYYKSTNKLKKFFICFTALIIGFISLYQSDFFGGAFSRLEMMIDMFINNNDKDLSTLRRMEWSKYGLNVLFPERPLWGYGIGVSARFTEGGYFHNNYTQLLVELGITGFFLYYFLFYSLLLKLWKRRYDGTSKMLITVIAVFLLCDFTNTTYYHKINYIFLGLGYVYLRLNKNIVIKNKK